MAATDARRRIKNAPLRVYGQILAVSTLLPITGGLTAMDAEISGDGGAFADCGAAETEIGTTGFFYVDLTAAETAYDWVTFQFKASNAGAVTYIEHICFEEASDSGVAQSGASTTITLRSGASATNDIYNGQQIEIVRGTGAGQVRAVTDYVGSSKVATVDRAWATNPDSTSVYVVKNLGQVLGSDIVPSVNVTQIAGSATAATNQSYLYDSGLILASVNDAAATTTSFIGSAGLSSSDDFYNSGMLIVTEGTLAGIARKISDYVGATKTITLANALPSAPANGSNFVILGHVR